MMLASNTPRSWSLHVVTLLSVCALLPLGCGGKTPLAQRAETIEQAMADVPDWFLSPPGDDDHFYGTGTSESGDLQQAVDDASHTCRVQIAQDIETRVSALFKQFAEDTGVGNDAEFLTMSTNVSKSVADTTITGTRTKTRHIVDEGGRFRAYVLLEVPVDDARARLYDAIKAEQRAWTRFRASEGFQDLEKEVEAYREFKAGEAGATSDQ